MVFIPALYGLGWLLSQPMSWLFPSIPLASRNLMGTLVSALLFLLVLPSWVRIRWNSAHPWQTLGVRSSQRSEGPGARLRGGLGWAFALLLLITGLSLAGGWGQWLGDLSLAELLNAVLLCIGVGLAEELLFRGWLWGELNHLIGPRLALPGQALIFSLVHTRFNLGFWPMLGLLIGLFLLGIALATRRRLDQRSLWGCVGLHGGLVGGWFALQSGLIQWSPLSPQWLTGPGGNPLGGVVGILALSALLVRQLTALAKAARPSTGARSA